MTTPIHSAVRIPAVLPTIPPTNAPIGLTPQMTKRTEAFIRPSSGRGHSRWRNETCATL